MLKMNNKKASLLNASSSVLYQLITALFSVVSRKVFLDYLGIELLGLNSTFNAIITIASLAETGLGSCVIYRLYSAIQKNDEHEINELINVARLYLSIVGIGVLVVAVIFAPMLSIVITDINVDYEVYIFFFLQVLATASSYFLAYKRLLLTADKKDFVGKFIDAGCNILFSIIKILICIYIGNYILYLLFSWIQIITSNIIVHVMCRRIYPFLRYKEGNKDRLKEMWPDMKNLFWGGLSAYLFSASDNIILSIGVSTLFVGYLGNYTTITTTLKTFILNLLLFMGPIIGNQVAAGNRDVNKTNDYLRLYDFMLYLVATALIIPEYVLIQDFVGTIWGTNYLLGDVIVALIILDQYITIVQDSNGVFMSVTGRFKELKIADGVAAILNVVSSIILCYFWGLAGILLGTVISRGTQWIIKAYYARKNNMMRKDNTIPRYVVRTLIKMVLFIIIVVFETKLYTHIIIDIFWARFILGGIMSVGLSIAIVMAMGLLSGDTQLIYKYIKKR